MEPMPRVPPCRVEFVTDCSSTCVAVAVQVGNPDALHNLGRTLQAEAGARLRAESRRGRQVPPRPPDAGGSLIADVAVQLCRALVK